MKIGIIPARYASTRFPGKPLALINNKPMIINVYDRCKEADLDDIFVATDDERIKNAVEKFGGKVIMTDPNHVSGTDRCAEAARLLNLTNEDIVINIQGDEPFIRKEEINLLVNMFQNTTTQIATLCKPISTEEELLNPNKVKVVFTKSNKALYFSRSPIPHPSPLTPHTSPHLSHTSNLLPHTSNLLPHTSHLLPHTSFKHIGIYGFRNDILQQITKLPVSTLEETEKLEQLRWLQNDFDIQIQICHYESLSIDTPEDLIQLTINN